MTEQERNGRENFKNEIEKLLKQNEELKEIYSEGIDILLNLDPEECSYDSFKSVLSIIRNINEEVSLLISPFYKKLIYNIEISSNQLDMYTNNLKMVIILIKTAHTLKDQYLKDIDKCECCEQEKECL